MEEATGRARVSARLGIMRGNISTACTADNEAKRIVVQPLIRCLRSENQACQSAPAQRDDGRLGRDADRRQPSVKSRHPWAYRQKIQRLSEAPAAHPEDRMGVEHVVRPWVRLQLPPRSSKFPNRFAPRVRGPHSFGTMRRGETIYRQAFQSTDGLWQGQ